MDIDAWMIALYIFAGFTFYMVMFILISPWFTRRAIMNGLKSKYGQNLLQEVLRDTLPQIKVWAAVELKKPETHAYIAEMAAALLVDCIDSEIDVEQPDKTVIKVPLLNYFSSIVVENMKMRFLGEKGVLSKELKGAEAEILMSQVPEQYRAAAAMALPMLKKYPVLGAIFGMAQQSGMLSGAKAIQGNQPSGGASVGHYNGA